MSHDVASASSYSFQRWTTESSASRSVTKSTSINIQSRLVVDQWNTRTSCHDQRYHRDQYPRTFSTRLDFLYSCKFVYPFTYWCTSGCPYVSSSCRNSSDMHALERRFPLNIRHKSQYWWGTYNWYWRFDIQMYRQLEIYQMMINSVEDHRLDIKYTYRKRSRHVLLLRRQGNHHQCIFPNVSFISLVDFNWSIVRRLFTEIDTQWCPR